MLADARLGQEVFGPAALLVRVSDTEQLITLAKQFQGQLSTTMQIDQADHALAARLLPILLLYRPPSPHDCYALYNSVSRS